MALADEFIDALDAQRFYGNADAVIVLRNHSREQTNDRIQRGLDLVLNHRADLLLMSVDTNTAEEARRFAAMARELRWTRVVIVTHQYHHYRAFLTFIKQFPFEIEVVSNPVRQYEMYLYEEMRKIEKYTDCASFKEGLEYLNDYRNTA